MSRLNKGVCPSCDEDAKEGKDRAKEGKDRAKKGKVIGFVLFTMKYEPKIVLLVVL